MSKLFLSHRLDLLVEHLAKEIFEDGGGVFLPRIIVVPNLALNQWILIQLTHLSETKGIAGCKVISIQEAIQEFLSPSSFTAIFCSVFSALPNFPEIHSYLQQSPKRRIELADQLTHLFIRYGDFAPSLFSADDKTHSWQKELLSFLFEKGKLRLPFQISPSSLPKMHCFGFDFIPSPIWEIFRFHRIYLFSPCSHYWEDLCTDRERKRLGKYWKSKGASPEHREEFDDYLKEAPPLLANWGKIGRETLKALDPFDLEIVDDYQNLTEQSSTLARLRTRLLNFTVSMETGFPKDSSIQISKTGSSRLREIEHLRFKILRLIEEHGLSFSDIAVFAPDIQNYVALIQLVFVDLPIRISGFEIGSKSFFYQGFHRFLELNFYFDDLMALFENPTFLPARKWDFSDLEKMREWLIYNEEELLDQFIFLFDDERKRIPTGLGDLLEQLLDLSRTFRADLESLKSSRTLTSWSKFISDLVLKYFEIDPSDDVEAAARSFFKQTLKEMEQADEGLLFPFEPIQALLKRAAPEGQLHPSHLHAIRFGKLACGVLLPARAVFLIGMDEESFPRRFPASSLDLLKRDPYEKIDQDRYLFLQTLFAAQEFLCMSYSHLSPEGNPINPSPFIEELRSSLDAPIQECTSPLPLSGKSFQELFPWPKKPISLLPEGEWTISLSELTSLARHPWEFYCQKKMGIRFDGKDEFSFCLQKAKRLKANLQKRKNLSDWPIGLSGEALKIEVEETSKKWDDAMRSWGISIESAAFRRSCRELRKRESGWEFPCLEFDFGPLRVKVIGEIKGFSERGFIHAGSDQLEGLLKVWPECLAALIASGRSEIYYLKSGKIKSLHRPMEALQAFISYYFLAQSAPSPLLEAWADPLLRKGAVEWEKKIKEKLAKKTAHIDDPVFDWVKDRVSLPLAADWFEEWQGHLRETFAELISLYPLRGKNAAV